MKLKMYSIFDQATSAYMRPFFMQADGQAIRFFMDVANDKESDIGKHPEDYSLCRIATFDDQSAYVEAEKVRVLITGLESTSRSGDMAREQEL